LYQLMNLNTLYRADSIHNFPLQLPPYLIQNTNMILLSIQKIWCYIIYNLCNIFTHQKIVSWPTNSFVFNSTTTLYKTLTKSYGSLVMNFVENTNTQVRIKNQIHTWSEIHTIYQKKKFLLVKLTW
jgi:hypothetical protein